MLGVSTFKTPIYVQAVCIGLGCLKDNEGLEGFAVGSIVYQVGSVSPCYQRTSGQHLLITI